MSSVRKNKHEVDLVLVMKKMKSGLYDAELKYFCHIFHLDVPDIILSAV